MRLRIRNGRIIDPSRNVDAVGDLCIEDGRIAPCAGTPDREIDARGLWVVPGLIDLHVHLRDPGQHHKESLETGLAAAARGGFTQVVAMPNTDPCADNPEVVRDVMERARRLVGPKVIQACAITVGRRGERLVDFEAVTAATGVRLFTDDGDGVADEALMAQAMERVAALDGIIAQHSEFSAISRKAAMHEGAVSRALGVSGQPIASEDDMVRRDIALARTHRCRLHVSHVSSAHALEAVAWARHEGLPVSAEVTPHHLYLTDDAVIHWGAVAKVAPPLRPQHHVDACRRALGCGIIDVVATDHAPHTEQDKQGPLDQAAFGLVGLETAVGLVLGMVHDGALTPARAIDALSCAPARLLGLPTGTLAPGRPADVTLIDPRLRWTVAPQRFASKGRNTPFAGWALRGAPVATIVNGAVVWEHEDRLS